MSSVATYLKRLGFLNELTSGTAWIAALAWFIYAGGLKPALQAAAVGIIAAFVFAFAIRKSARSVKPLPNTAILITGTSSGIGADSTVAFAKQGFTVFATVRKIGDIDKVKAAAGAGVSDRILPVLLDVTNQESIAAAALSVSAEISARGLALQSLINNAGYGENTVLEIATPTAVEAQFRTNVFGLIYVTNAFLPLLRSARGRTSVRPSVVMISSAVGKATFPAMGLYTATKYAVESLADAYQTELAAQGINVIVCEPGVTATQFAATAMSALSTNLRAAPAATVEPDIGKLYKDIAANMSQVQIESPAFPVGFVTDTLLEAVTQNGPHARYRATPDAHFIVTAGAVSPDVAMAAIRRNMAKV